MQTGALTPDNATPGRILAAARTERGMSVSEVAQRLKFSLRHIEALEADRYDALPSGPFVRGMIRTYAKLLGVDPVRLLEDLPQPKANSEPAMEPRDMSVPFPQDSRPGSHVYLLLSMLIIVAVVVVLAEWFIRSQLGAPEGAALPPVAGESAARVEPLADPIPLPGDAGATPAQPEPEGTMPVPPPSESMTSVSQPVAETTPPAAAIELAPIPSAGPSPPAPWAGSDRDPELGSGTPPPGRARLTFTFEVESWVEVRDAEGNTILSAINPAGSERRIVGTAPFSIVIGNASGVRLSYNGKPVALAPHRESDVARLTLE